MTNFYAGSLIGYRHFRTFTVAPVAESTFFLSDLNLRAVGNYYYEYQEGWNTARCEIKQYRPNYLKKLKERIDYLRQIELENLRGGGVYDYRRELDRVKAEADREKEVKRALSKHTLKDCTCGFYASYSPLTKFYGDTASKIYFHAAVETAGKIVLGTKGFRASKLRILALTMPESSDGVIVCDCGCGIWGPVGSPVTRYLISSSVGGTRYYLPSREEMVYRYPGIPIFDTYEEMVAKFPQPDRTGLPVDIAPDHMETWIGAEGYGC